MQALDVSTAHVFFLLIFFFFLKLRCRIDFNMFHSFHLNEKLRVDDFEFSMDAIEIHMNHLGESYIYNFPIVFSNEIEEKTFILRMKYT